MDRPATCPTPEEETDKAKAELDRLLKDPQVQKRVRKATDKKKRTGLTGSGIRKALGTDD